MSSETSELPEGWVAVYVPRPGTSLRKEVAQGSGVVGPEAEKDDRLRVDFEGNLHGLPELARYADRVQRAAYRHQWQGSGGAEGFPTSACAQVDRMNVIRVGRFDPLTRNLEVEDRSTLRTWLDLATIPDRELELSDRSG